MDEHPCPACGAPTGYLMCAPCIRAELSRHDLLQVTSKRRPRG